MKKLFEAGVYMLPGGIRVDAFDTPFNLEDFSAADLKCDPAQLKQLVAGLNVAQAQRANSKDQGHSLNTIEKMTELTDRPQRLEQEKNVSDRDISR